VTTFHVLGAAHVIALVAIAAVAFLLVWLVRRASAPQRFVVRALLTAVLVGTVVFELTRAAREGWLSVEVVVPLHLCDAAILLAVVGLLTGQRHVVNVLYFWACSGTVLALLTPDLLLGFPAWEFFVFFGLHGGVVVSALVLVFGIGIRPRRNGALTAFIVTNAYAGAVGLVNLLAGTNFLYLCAKPESATLLDLMGPWPAYLLVGDAIALVLFWLLGLPFRGRPAAERETTA
jgi:hypothetical integral membrane protein (TIGR02206 family)